MTVIFDYDGTLHNTAPLYGRAFRQAYALLVRDGLAPAKHYTDEDISRYVGVSAPEMWRQFMPDLPQDKKDAASALIGREMIAGIRRGEAVLYRGIPDVLHTLKAAGYRLVILSNCHTAYMDAHRQALGLDQYFDGYFCAEAYGFVPKEQIFPFLRAHCPDSRYLMVGDRASDIRVGLVNGLSTIGCLYGFGTPDELAQADRIVHTPAALPQTVRSLWKESLC